MSKSNLCPECGNLLAARVKRCTCGWFQPEKRAQVNADHRCQYIIAQRRCPLPGTMCPYPYGNGPWYCSGHLRSLDDPKLGEAVLIDAEKNYQEIMESRIDWRNKLIK